MCESKCICLISRVDMWIVCGIFLLLCVFANRRKSSSCILLFQFLSPPLNANFTDVYDDPFKWCVLIRILRWSLYFSYTWDCETNSSCIWLVWVITASFNKMRTLKFKSQPTSAFVATVNQMFGSSSQLPATVESSNQIDRCAQFRQLNSARQ